MMPVVLLQAEDLQALEQAGNADAGYEDNCERPMEVSMIPYIEDAAILRHTSQQSSGPICKVRRHQRQQKESKSTQKAKDYSQNTVILWSESGSYDMCNWKMFHSP